MQPEQMVPVSSDIRVCKLLVNAIARACG